MQLPPSSVWSSNIVGVKLFRGTEAGGVVPIGATVTSGAIILMMVPGVEAGIVPLLAGMVTTGILRSVGRSDGSITLPAPVTESVILTAELDGTFTPVLITFLGKFENLIKLATNSKFCFLGDYF